MGSVRHALTWGLVVGAVAVTGKQAMGDLIVDDWEPVLHFNWWISGTGGGAIDLVAEAQGDAVWEVSGYFGDAQRVMAWSLIVDATNGVPVITIDSLIAKNYSPDDATFSLSVDLDLGLEIGVADQLTGEIHLILAGIDGTLSTPKSADFLWSLRSDGQVKGGVFAHPWSLYVASGGVEVFGGIDIGLNAQPAMSYGFGWDLMLTPGEAVSVHGMLAAPAPSGLPLLLGGLVCGNRAGRKRRRPRQRH
jgi:hypothetical protein